MSFWERFYDLCISKGTKPNTVAKELGFSSAVCTQWKKGAQKPSAKKVSMLAEYFGVSTDYLLGNGVSEAMVGRPCTFAGRELTKDEAFLLSLYSKIPPQEQQRLIGRAEYIAEQAEEHARELEQAKRLEIQQSTMDESTLCETIDIPFSTLLVSAGLGDDLLAQDGTQETISVPATPTTRRANFAVRVNGDSMEPMYSDGDIVLVEQDQDVPQGQVGIFAVNGRGYIKKAGRRRLISINDAYDDILISPDDSVKCFGLVIGKL